jgi:hypothetical protein
MLPLDDAYIHLAMARNVVETGVWGLTPTEFASSTSSPLYTAVLALGTALVGPHLWLAMLVNLLAIAGVTAFLGREHAASAWLAIAVAPLPYLAALGMEHVLHAAVVLLLVRAALTGDRRAPLLAAAACLARYESAFVVLALAGLLARERRLRDGFWLAAAGGGALIVYGAWCTANGALPLPNSLVMKSALIGGWTSLWGQNLAEGAALLVVAAAVVLRAALDPGARREAGVSSRPRRCTWRSPVVGGSSGTRGGCSFPRSSTATR